MPARAPRPPRTISLPLLLSLVLLGAMPHHQGLAQRIGPADMEAMKARSIGPAGMSGRVAAIDAVESDPDIIFVGAATGGLWKSVNGGHTWESLFDNQRVLGIGAVAVFQGDPDIIWVGTGEGDPRNSAGVGAGVFRSTDGGFTWTFLGLERSERIHRIVLHPTDPDVAFLGVMGPAWSDGDERGVYRTTDGGVTWQRVLYVNERTGVGDLVMDPANPRKLLAGMWEFRRWPWFFQSRGPGSGLFLSDDGGDTWTRLSTGDGMPSGELGRIRLAIARSNPSVVYALIEASRSVLLRSDDGGGSWRTVNDQHGMAPGPLYSGSILVDPRDEDRLFNVHPRLMFSEDGGRDFRAIARNIPSDFHALWIHPGDPRLLYLGSAGGVYISRDGGAAWQLVDNLPVGQFNHISLDMEVPFNVYGGMADNGSWRGPSDVWEGGGIRNSHWKELGFGDGFGTLVDPTDPSLGYSTSRGGGLVRFDLRTGERKGIRPWAPDGVELRFNWNAPITADPFEIGTIYFGSQFVHRSVDGGNSWQIISGDLTTDNVDKQRQRESGGLTREAAGAENHSTILTIAPSPVERELIWVGSDDGRVHLSRSGGGDWEDVGVRIRGVPQGTWIPHIEASKHHGSVAYVVFDDHRRGNWRPYILRTEDYGRRWTNIAPVDEIWGFVHTLEEDPVTPNLLFAGTEFGLYVSVSRGADWFPWTHGVPPAPVRSLAVHPRDHDLVVGTHGRALYVLDDIRPLRALARDPAVLASTVHLFDPPPAYLRSVAAAEGYHFPGDAAFQGETRAAGAMLTFLVSQADAGRQATIDILDAEGSVIRTLEVPARGGLNRVTWDLREDSDPGAAAGGRAAQSPGLEVLPGLYRVRVRVGGVESSRQLNVLPDPRIEIPLVARIQKRQALQRGLELGRAVLAFQERRLAVNQDLDRIRDLLASRQGEEAQTLRGVSDSIRAELDGINEGLGEVNRHRSVVFEMASTRDAPTEAEHIALFRMEESLDQVISRYNALLGGRIAGFRGAVRGAGLGGFLGVRFIPRVSGG
jgi:photosystem II stability/assembly factor-like uncharacterized protein